MFKPCVYFPGMLPSTAFLMIFAMLFVVQLQPVQPSASAPSCDLIVRVKSQTDKPFQAQVTTPDQEKSDKWNFTKKLQREIYQRKGRNCTTGQWQVESFDQQGTLKDHKIINLSGVGFVQYEVKDDLILVQTERQGASCVGECAALGTVVTKKNPKPITPPTNA